MGILDGLRLLASELSEFFAFFRGFWDCLPFVVRALIVFAFGAVVIFSLIKMLT